MFVNHYEPFDSGTTVTSVWTLDTAAGCRNLDDMSSNAKFPNSMASAISLGQGVPVTSDLSATPPSLLTSQQVTTMVSLPQNFCFTSQPTQVSATSQPHSGLSVTLGFPMATALNSSTIPQQFVQSLSMGQQPAICASLPQSISFPLNQALFTVPNPAGTSTGQFLSTTFNQFPGLSSLIMGGQQSVIPGALMATSTAGPTQIQTLGPLGAQSLSFPVSSGPVVTELPPDPPQPQQQQLQLQHPQQQEQQQMQLHQAPGQQMHLIQQPQQQVHQHSHYQTPTQQLALLQQQLKVVQQQQQQHHQQQQEKMCQQMAKLQQQHQQQQQQQQQQQLQQQQQQHQPVQQNLKDVEKQEVTNEEAFTRAASCVEADSAVMDVSETRSPLAHCASAAKEEAVSESTDITETEASVLQQETASEVKQEALLDRMVQSPTSPPLLDRNECSSSPIKMQGSMVVKEESSSLVEMEDEKQEETGKEMELLGELKQEAVEDEEEEEMPLPDSTPTVDDMEHGYEQRLSPSPMASLQLTRADTTTTTSVAAAHVSSLLTEDEDMEMKLLGMQDCNPDGVHVEYDESEFVWEEYLQETGASAVPPTAFKHVECSLESGFVKGMRVEVANKSAPGTYWVASIIMTCGPLLRLRYEGYEEDGSADFWSDLSACEIHPIGWCTENGQVLQPPEALKEKHEDWPAVLRESLKSARTVPSYLLDITTGTTPVDQLKQGMRLELQDSHKPSQVWLARIIENVGGRLYLRVEGMDSGIADFWAFYLNENLHPIGWGKQMGYFYHPPQVLLKQGLSEEEIKHILESALREANDQQLPADIFKDQEEIVQHTFQCGMKLEAVNPNSRNQICPATVVEVIDSRYFVVEIDDLQETDAAKRIHFCGHSRTPTIFPIQWTIYKGIKLTPPPGWCRTDFSWTEYLAHCRAMAAPETCFDLRTEEHEFERGMKLEAVNPHNPNQICAATITKIVDHLMWVHLDSSTRIVASHVEHISSHNLFPVGWCESNGYQLRPPRKTGIRPGMGSPCKRVAVVQPEMADGLPGKEEENEGRTYCPKIYFNHRCFSGPYLSKGRIAELPQSVGPGPLQLVMKEVLTMLISVAYKSCRVLREIQLDGPPNPAMHQQILRAKYKSKSYCAVVEICRTTAQLEDFCRQVCIKLECCPNLISPHFVGSNCPENCSQLTKTKYTYYYGKKKRKIGRPPGGHTNLENGPKKATKRRKRRRIGQLVPRKSHSIHDEEEEEDEGMEEDKASIASDTHTVDSSSTGASRDDFNPDTTVATGKTAMSKRLKRKYTHHIPPPSEIRTRGAKLPRYSFERRTHKKILLSQPSQSISGLRSKSLQFHQPSMTSSPPASETSISRPRAATPLLLDKNPLQWTVSDTVEFIQTTDCSHVAKVFREQEIDGQALLLLTLPTVQEHLELKLGPAIKLCHQIERVKRAFYEQYATSQPRSHR